MTGFARAEGGEGDHRWIWEARSVNGRGLDVRCRLPSGLEALEPEVRQAVAERCKRGNVSVTLTLSGAPSPGVRINRDVLDRVIGLMGELEGKVKAAPPRLDGLLAVRGVVELIDELPGDIERERRRARLSRELAPMLDELATMRRREGAKLSALAQGHLDEIERLGRASAVCAAAQPEALRARLRKQLQALTEGLPAVPEERLAQEAAIIVARGDVREELDRLDAHIAAARSLIGDGGAVGRKLDFLCQELNREANTLCAKSGDVELTNLGLGLKVAIDQLREQIQNIE
jgi:uncharacterized protein (TIGR00255 family)